MEPDQLLQALAVSLHLPNLRFDANGCARVLIDNAPALNFERAHGAIHVYSVLAALPPEGREAVYAEMLQANLFGESTSGATLAIDQSRGEILMCRTAFAEQSTGPLFVSMVEVFVDSAKGWQERLACAPQRATQHEPFAGQQMLEHFVRG